MDKLNYFVTIYHDEDIRSIIYRYHMMGAQGSFAKTNQNLFGKAGQIPAIFPGNLKQVIARTSYDLERFLQNHTYCQNDRKDGKSYL
jgi:hypothetical protein